MLSEEERCSLSDRASNHRNIQGLKGIVHPKVEFHPFATHGCVESVSQREIIPPNIMEGCGGHGLKHKTTTEEEEKRQNTQSRQSNLTRKR